jgi:hypothetical protein
MRMHFEEPEAFRELCTLRNAIHNQFIKMEKTLIDKKEKLFRGGDPSKWGSGNFSCFKDEKEMHDLKDKLMTEKQLAFTYMLPKET